MGDDKLNLVFIGDGNVGKTCLIKSFLENKFPQNLSATIFDQYDHQMCHEGKEVPLCIWDCGGQESLIQFRELCYEKCDCFVICFSYDSVASLRNVQLQWVQEIQNANVKQKPNRILVGCKSDLKQKSEITQEDIDYTMNMGFAG